MSTRGEAEKLRSVNVKMTDAMSDELTRKNPNRSKLVRVVLAAILKAHAEGQHDAFEAAVEAAQRSSARVQKLTGTTGIAWRKVIVWIPERMHQEIVAEMRSLNLRPADFIRGAIIGFTGVDPTEGIIGDGRELWTSAVVDEGTETKKG